MTEDPKETDHVVDIMVLEVKSFEDSKATAFIKNETLLVENILEDWQLIILRG
ncbi:MAG: hypothetical protein CM1200mP18_10340 [Gammaproteobacteria bacterium]|nr:MAG: hypothetical protein CM1200mP18_10340 [Gammaproteobacteria bacterium]